MKKIEGYVRDKNDPRQTIYQLDTASQGHFEQPAILLIAEGGEQLPEVMTKQEVKKLLEAVCAAIPKQYDERVDIVATRFGITL